MARLYSRRKGKSGSKKPVRAETPKWVKADKRELEKLIETLATEGKSSAQIGIVLRDQHGIPDVNMITGKSISSILREKNLTGEIPEDISALMKKASQIQDHLKEHKKDMDAKRGLQLTESKIRRLAKYYKRKKVLSLTWKYSSKTLTEVKK